MRTLLGRRHREDGAVAVTVAMVLIILFIVTALIVDVGFQRADTRANQSHADFAALAAAGLESTARDQCRLAVAYFAANAPEVVGPVDDGPCDDLPATCNAGTLSVTTDPIEAGPYRLFITHPVADDDPAMVVEGQEIVDEVDGVPCERLKTEVRRERGMIFGGVAGRTVGGSWGDAVVRRTSGGGEDQFASLIVLEEVACNTLNATGGANIHVRRGTDPVTGEPIPGIITVDSLATGGSGSDNCNTGGTVAIIAPASGFVQADDFIFSYGLRAGNPAKVFNPAHVPSRLRPEPVEGANITREPVDHRFNCRSSYPAQSNAAPQLPRASQGVGPCPDTGTRPAYIDALRGTLQSGSLGSQGFVTVGGNGNCPAITYNGSLLTVGANTSIHTAGRLHITCSPGANFVIDIRNAEYVVFDRNITSSPTLFRVQGRSTTGATVYFRAGNGGIDVNGGIVDFEDVFVYIDSRGQNNQDKSVVIAGNASLVWRAPVSDTIRANCDAWGGTGLPPTGCLAPLALWSNSQRLHDLGGSGGIAVRGTFFAPNSTYRIRGGAGFDFQQSQFFALNLRTTGGGTIVLIPNPQTNIPIPLTGRTLIR